MDRRDFLKGTGLVSVAGVTAVALAQSNGHAMRWARLREVTVGDRMYRVDGGSNVFVSIDGGATWAVHSRFADRFSIRTIGLRGRGTVRIAVTFDGHRRFALFLADDQRSWQTA